MQQIEGPVPVQTMQSASFVDRRKASDGSSSGFDRRQFGNNHADLSPAAKELAIAIDGYKLQHRRRFITYEEMHNIICSLGYRKSAE